MLAPATSGQIVLERVSRTFGALTLFEDVSFRVDPGSIVEVTGDNGSGKTSLLRMIAGTLDPSTGYVSVCGRPPGNGMAGIVPSGDRALYWRLTGRQELAFYARVGGMSGGRVGATVSSAAEMLHAGDLLARRIGTMSTGQRRRLMVARCLVGRAPVQLWDEPFADLDAAARDVVGAAARSWVAEGGVVMWTSPIAGDGPTAPARYRLSKGRLSRG